MTLFRVRPTGADIAIADETAWHMGPGAEHAAEALTWSADEHILCAFAVAWWAVFTVKGSEGPPRQRPHSSTLIASALPHLLKSIFDQRRPDRLTSRVTFMGYRFPANGLMHFPPATPCTSERWDPQRVCCRRSRNAIWTLGAGLVLTRIVRSGALDKRPCRGARFGRANRAVPQAVLGFWTEDSRL